MNELIINFENLPELSKDTVEPIIRIHQGGVWVKCKVLTKCYRKEDYSIVDVGDIVFLLENTGDEIYAIQGKALDSASSMIRPY